MPGKSIQLGPFKGGLNTHSDNSAIDDAELVICENFELDFDGSLVSRPPISDTGVALPLQSTGDMQVLGYYTAPGNVNYLLATDGVSKTYYFTGSTWTLITSTFAATDMAQFNGKAWLVAPVGSAAPGGSWSPSANFTPDSNMPKGDTIAVYKSRLWIAQGKAAVANNTYVYFSGLLGDTPFWPVAPNFIDVGSGDGQNVIKLVGYFNNLLIFRDNSIYTLTYGTDPATAVFSILVPGIGLTDKHCVAVYQAYLYFMHNEKVYEFFNNRATQINQRVPFSVGSQAGIYLPYSVSLFNQRVMVTFWDKLYVFNLLTRTWTTWKSTAFGSLGRFVTSPATDGPEVAIVHSTVTVSGTSRSARTLQIVDAVGTATEAMTCTFRTKNYNYQSSSVMKRLFWGGIDAIFRGQMTARAIPIFFAKQLTWGQLAQMTWGQVAQKTWGTLSTDNTVIEKVINSPGSSAQRKFQKLFKSFFFRQLAFEAIFETDGSVTSAPVQVFSIMTYVLAKADVSEATS